MLHVARWKYRTQKSRQKLPSGHDHTTLSGCVFATEAPIDNRKNLLSSNMSSRCPHNMVNFGPLAAEIGSGVWGTPPNFNWFRVLTALLHGTPAVGISQTLRHWTEGATYIRQGDHHVGHWPTFYLCLFCAVHFFWLVNLCFSCVRFSFSIPSQEIGLGNISQMTCFVSSGT